MIEKVFKELNLPPGACRVYQCLLEYGGLSARRIAEHLNLPRPTVYDNLKQLIALDLVSEKDEDNKKLFKITESNKISRIINDKIENLKKDSHDIRNFVKKFAIDIQGNQPNIKFYSGITGIKQVLSDLLWHENIKTTTMWPISEMIDVLGDEYLENLNRRRIRNNISVRAIWPTNKAVNIKEYPFLGVGKAHLRSLRIAPESMNWEMSYWQYADKVAFISTKNESFGFVIQSKEFVSLMLSQFEVIWELSTPIKAHPTLTDSFLKTVY